MFLTDEEGHIVAWNRAAESLFFLAAQDVCGKLITDVQRSLTKPMQKDTASLLAFSWVDLQAAMRSGELSERHRRLDVAFCRPDGKVIYLEQTIFSVPWGDEYRLAGIYRDITDEYLVVQRDRRRRALLEKVLQLGKAVNRISNLQQCYLEIYQAIQQGLGFDRVGLFTYDPVLQRVQGIIGTERTGGVGDKSSVVQYVQEGDNWHQLLSNPKGLHFVDNSQTTADVGDNMTGVKENVVVAAWAGEVPVGFIGVDNLLTDRPIAPEQVEALQFFAGYAGLAIQNARWNEEMEKRVAERTAALGEVNRELESLSYTIAHDLRSPLRAVVAYSRILQDPHTDEMGDDETILRKIHIEGQRMGRMVDDFLFFLNLGRTPLDIQLVDMNVLVQRVIQAVQARSPSCPVAFSVLPLPPCRADPYLAYLLLTELIANAVQFTAVCQEPRVEIGTMIKGRETCYYVRDNGIGFNMDYVDKLYGVFERLHHPEAFGDTGTGIGLANVRRILSRHNGHIWAESAEGQGATFWFRLGTEGAS